MRFVGKPELLSDTFLESKLDSIVADSSNETSLTSNLTSKDLHYLLPETLVLLRGEVRVGLFAIRLKGIT